MTATSKFPRKKVTGEKRSLLEIIDFKFLIRVVLALTIDTLLVNVLLGTYWCSIMYGKGFMFLSYNEIYQKSNPAAYQHFLNLQCYRNR